MGFLMKGLAALIAVIYAAIVVLIERQSFGMFSANGASLTALPLVVVVCCSLWAMGEILDRLKTLLDRQGAISVTSNTSSRKTLDDYPPLSAGPSVRER